MSFLFRTSPQGISGTRAARSWASPHYRTDVDFVGASIPCMVAEAAGSGAATAAVWVHGIAQVILQCQ